MTDGPFRTVKFEVELQVITGLRLKDINHGVRRIIEHAFETSDWGREFVRVRSIKRRVES